MAFEPTGTAAPPLGPPTKVNQTLTTPGRQLPVEPKVATPTPAADPLAEIFKFQRRAHRSAMLGNAFSFTQDFSQGLSGLPQDLAYDRARLLDGVYRSIDPDYQSMDVETMANDFRTTGGRYIRNGRMAGHDLRMENELRQNIQALLDEGTPESINQARALMNLPQITSDEMTILAEDVAEALMQDILDDPEWSVDDLDEGERLRFDNWRRLMYGEIVKDRIIQEAIERVDAYREDAGWFRDVRDFANFLVPMMETIQIESNIYPVLQDILPPGFDIRGGDALGDIQVGDFLDNVYTVLSQLPPEQYHRVVNRILDTLLDANVLSAAWFVQGLNDWNITDRNLYNVFGTIDAVSVVPIGAVLRIPATTGRIVLNSARAARQARLETILEGLGRVPGQIARAPVNILTHVGTQALAPIRRAAALRRAAARTRNNPIDIAAVGGRTTREGAVISEVTNRLKRAQSTAQGTTRTTRRTSIMDSGPLYTIRQSLNVIRAAFDVLSPYNYLPGARGFTRSSFAPGRAEADFISQLSSSNMTDAIARIARLTESGEKVGLEEAKKFLFQEFRKVPESVFFDFRVANRLDPVTRMRYPENVDVMEAWLRKQDGTDFTDKLEAANWANRMGLKKGDYTLQQHPDTLQWHPVISRNIDETQGVRNVPIEEIDRTRPINWRRKIAGASQTFGQFLRGTRGAAVRFNNELQALTDKMLRPITKLTSLERKELDMFMRHARNGGLSPGMFNKKFMLPHEMADEFKQLFGYAPSARQVSGYRALMDATHFNWSLKNLHILESKGRAGIYKMNLKYGKGSFDFEGRVVGRNIMDDALQHASTDNPVVIKYVDDQGRYQNFVFDGTVPRGTDQRQLWKNIQSALDDESLSMLQRTDLTRQNYLKFFGPKNPMIKKSDDANSTDIPDFFIAKTFRRNPLDPEQVPFETFPRVDNSPYFIKVGITSSSKSGGKSFYWGDRSISNARSAKEANELLQHFRLAAAKVDGMLQFNKGKGLTNAQMRSVRTFIRNKLPHVDADELINDLVNNPFMRNEKLWDITKTGQGLDALDNIGGVAKGGSTREFIRNNFQRADRNAYDLGIARGIDDTPAYQLSDIDELNPYSVIKRNARQALMGIHSADMTKASAEQFVREFADVLSTEGQAVAKTNPSIVLQNFQAFSKEISEGMEGFRMYQTARYVAQSYKDLLGDPGIVARKAQGLSQSVAESLFNTANHKSWFGTADDKRAFARMVAGSINWAATDVPVALRALAFKTYLGLFNPVQLFKQAQTVFVSSLMTTNPLVGLRAGFLAPWVGAYLGSAVGSFFEASIGKVAKFFAKVTGIDPDDFEEALRLMRESSISRVSHEHAYHDSWNKAKITRGNVYRFLDFGDTFFKMGEGLNRITAFLIAHGEWRAANKTAQMTPRTLQEIIARQDDLSVNMTRASNAQWQKGWTSFPTQFFSYQIRLMEGLWSQNLSGTSKSRIAARFRILGGMSLMYGVPIGAMGTAAGVFPWGEIERRWMLGQEGAVDRLVNPDVTSFDYLYRNGLAGFITTLIAGEPTNAAESYGPHGLDFTYELWKMATGETQGVNIIEILGGAGVATGLDWIQGFGPITTYFGTLLRGEGDISDLMWSDIEAILSSISSYSRGDRALFAINNGYWISRNGEAKFGSNTDAFTQDGPVTTAQGILSAVMGIDPAKSSILYSIEDANRAYDLDRSNVFALIREQFNDYAQIFHNPGISDQDKENIFRRISQRVAVLGRTIQATDEEISDLLNDVLGEFPQDELLELLTRLWDTEPQDTLGDPEDYGTAAQGYVQRESGGTPAQRATDPANNPLAARVLEHID